MKSNILIKFKLLKKKLIIKIILINMIFRIILNNYHF